MEVVHYTDPDGQDLFDKWFHTLRDKKAVARITSRAERLELGLFGDCRYLKGGISELRIDLGPGYRIYFAKIGISSILLLCGGTKRTQKKDIEVAERRLKNWLSQQPD